MIEYIKLLQIIHYLDKCPMLLSGQVLHRGNLSYLFWNLEKTLRNLLYRREITYQLLLTGLFHKLISVQVVGHNMLHLHAAQQLPPLRFMHQVHLSYQQQWCWAEQAIFIWHFSKQNISKLRVLKLRMKTENPDIRFLQNT